MDKPYTIDGEPVTVRELIRQASGLSPSFAREWVKRTSEAAAILRGHGHVVARAHAAQCAEEVE